VLAKTKGVAKAIGRGPRTWSPGAFFVIDTLVLVLLLLVGPFHVHTWGIFDGFHNSFQTVLPSIVPWAGALGGVSISIVGVAGYSIQTEWRPDRFGYWHLTRPLLGAVFGTTAVLIVALLLQNVKGTTVSDAGYTPAGQVVLAVIAFVVGFREETFRTLVMRVVDMIISPSAADAGGLVAFVPNVVDFADVPKPTSKKATTHLFNGSPNTLHVAAGALTVDDQSIVIDANAADVDLSPGTSLPVTLTWTPTEVVAMTATLSAQLTGMSPTCGLRGSGVAG
jgi:Abnormal spindle-like microcephaly-assoc'd, ASPM-SPD-2-Hydin